MKKMKPFADFVLEYVCMNCINHVLMEGVCVCVLTLAHFKLMKSMSTGFSLKSCNFSFRFLFQIATSLGNLFSS